MRSRWLRWRGWGPEWRDHAWAGAAAALASAALMLGLRLAAGVPSLPELVQDRVLALLPGQLFGLALERLQLWGKPLFFVSLVLAQVVVGIAAAGGVGLALHRGRCRQWSIARRALALVTTLAVLAVGLALTLLAGGLPGNTSAAVSRAPAAAPAAALLRLALVAPYALYGLLLGLLIPLPARSAAAVAPSGTTGELTATRRRTAARVASGVSAVVGGAALWRLIAPALDAPGQRAGTSHLSLAAPGMAGKAAISLPDGVAASITPVAEFYVVSKNFSDPTLAAGDWSLEVGGLVEHPFTLTYDALLKLSAVDVERTLECISNPIGGTFMSNAVWRGVRLDELLRRAGVQPQATEAQFTCADRYVEHLPLADVLDGETLLVYLMNGEPLTPKHGFPARVLTTGHYGMKNPKWVQKIEAVTQAERGYWERRGWTPTAPVRTMCRIDVPAPGQQVTVGQLTAGGVAFAAERGIQRVEVSLDMGATWLPAAIERGRPRHTWVRWAARIELPHPGQVQIMARAIDGTGDVQDAILRRNFPSGASGYHRVLVEWIT